MPRDVEDEAIERAETAGHFEGIDEVRLADHADPDPQKTGFLHEGLEVKPRSTTVEERPKAVGGESS